MIFLLTIYTKQTTIKYLVQFLINTEASRLISENCQMLLAVLINSKIKQISPVQQQCSHCDPLSRSLSCHPTPDSNQTTLRQSFHLHINLLPSKWIRIRRIIPRSYQQLSRRLKIQNKHPMRSAKNDRGKKNTSIVIGSPIERLATSRDLPINRQLTRI